MSDALTDAGLVAPSADGYAEFKNNQHAMGRDCGDVPCAVCGRSAIRWLADTPGLPQDMRLALLGKMPSLPSDGGGE